MEILIYEPEHWLRQHQHIYAETLWSNNIMCLSQSQYPMLFHPVIISNSAGFVNLVSMIQ